MRREARFYEKLEDKKIRCGLCHHRCVVKDGHSGICKIRVNDGGTFFQNAYGELSALAVDPIEKKPLYHFYPSSKILSIGTNGCNLSCKFCQNWSISTQETNRDKATPFDLLKMAKEQKSIGIAYTYNEPMIWYEFVYDCAKVFKDAGLKNVLVTNGHINPEPLKELLPLIDAANIDLKGFTEEFYKWVGGDLETVKNTIITTYESGTLTELTNLIVTDKNDNIEDFKNMCEWIAGISKDIPLHISRYFPGHEYEAPATTPETLDAFYEEAKKHLNYVYVGNFRKEGAEDSYCPHCGELLVQRSGFLAMKIIRDNRCTRCGKELYFCS